jgi:predicted ferric reductase
MRNLQKIGPVLVYILAFIPIVIWFPYSSWSSASSVYRSLGQATALIGVILFSVNFILSARFRFIENLFFGLNRVFIEHHKIGAYAFILLLFHPTFILIQYLTFSVSAAFSVLIPSMDNLANTYGLIALLTMTALLILTFYIKMHYETWKKAKIKAKPRY